MLFSTFLLYKIRVFSTPNTSMILSFFLRNYLKKPEKNGIFLKIFLQNVIIIFNALKVNNINPK